MSEEVPFESRFRIDRLIREIAKREYPPVFVVEPGSEEEKFMWSLEGYELSDQQWIQLAKERGIAVLSGVDVIHNLRGVMDSADEYMLRDQVLKIFAAKSGTVLIYDLDDHRSRLKSEVNAEPVSVKMVAVEEVTLQETREWMFFESLEATARKWPNVFLIPPTEAVLDYLAEHGEYEGL